jgi:lipoate-protein ligase A
VTATVWRLLITPDRPGSWNMACDHALAEGVGRGAPPVLRLYGWSPHAVSLGYAQPVRRLAAAIEALRRRGLDVVRRPTGGGAVLHARELTYAAALPSSAGGGRPREACAAIHRALAAGLARLGIGDLEVGGGAAAAPAVVAPRAGGEAEEGPAVASGAARGPVPAGRRPAVCFRALGESEIAWHGRKLVGSAQRRLGRALLQHGSIPLSGAAEGVASLAVLEDGAGGGARGAGAAADLERAAGRAVSVGEAADAVAAGFAAALGMRFEAGPLESGEEARIASLVAERYGREAFLLRV